MTKKFLNSANVDEMGLEFNEFLNTLRDSSRERSGSAHFDDDDDDGDSNVDTSILFQELIQF